MSRMRWLLVPVAGLSLVAGVAVAGPQSSETTPFTADFQAGLVNEKQRACDASHTAFRVLFKGTETSSDPRLAGDMTVRVRSVVNNDSGWGRTTGKVIVRETGTHKPKFGGHVVGVIEPDGQVEGFLRGTTVAKPHAKVFANFNVQQDEQTGAVTGEIGKESLSGMQDGAILTNACRGGHQHQNQQKQHKNRP
jgi:hypothetical protein